MVMATCRLVCSYTICGELGRPGAGSKHRAATNGLVRGRGGDADGAPSEIDEGLRGRGRGLV